MADRHTDDESSTELRTDGGERKDDPTGDLEGVGRRSFMKLAGAGAAIAATGAVGAASALEGVDADTVVDLGEEGLSDGDLIDPYLDEHFDDGVEVHVPAGEYDWGGSGFSGDFQNAAVIGQGEVILNTVEGQYRNVIVATEGTVAVKNFTVRGKVEASRIRIEAEEGARVVVDNWNFPDGSEAGTSGRAFYCPGDHVGEAVIRNCYIKGFDDNGIYASSPGRDAGGRVVVENCFVHNNNIAGIRIGGRESLVRNCVVLNDGPAPVAESGHRNQRGIRIANYEHSVDMRIEDVDVIHSSEELGGGGPIRWSNDDPLSTGHMQGVRVHNVNSNVAAIGEKRDRAEDWTGDDVTVSGDGDLDVPDWFTNVSTGDEISPSDPTEDGDSTTTDDADSDGDSTDADSDESGSTDGGETELVLVSTDSGGLEYTFTATGPITPLYDRDTYRANRSAPSDEAVENDDGTWTATGATAGGSNESGDSYLFEGGLTEFSATGDVDALTVYADGEEVSIDELTDKYGASDEDAEDSTDGEDTDDEDT
ncbi:MAG: right-handed parallel beta-helix repeat-containing protein, partial [Halanaeroarchaeum sp.]